MKIFIFVLLISILSMADNYMSSSDILKQNNKQTTGITTYTKKNVCESITKEQCYKIDDKNPRYHTVIDNDLVENKTLKDAYIEEVTINNSEKINIENKQNQRIIDIKTCINTLNNDNLLQCVKKTMKEVLKSNLTQQEL